MLISWPGQQVAAWRFISNARTSSVAGAKTQTFSRSLLESRSQPVHQHLSSAVHVDVLSLSHTLQLFESWETTFWEAAASVFITQQLRPVDRNGSSMTCYAVNASNASSPHVCLNIRQDHCTEALCLNELIYLIFFDDTYGGDKSVTRHNME